jgi:trehalose synthase-fused probable maltokinase
VTDVAERLGLDGQFDDADLIAYIRDRRWFGSRSKDIAAVTMVDAVPLPGDLPTWLALLELRFETGKHQTYQVVLGVAAAGTVDEEITGLDDGVLYEASQLPRLGRLIVDAPPTGSALVGLDGKVEFRGIGPRPDADGEADVRPLGADQSNTSVVVADSILVKMYRKVEAGLNPELEMLLFLTEHDFANSPQAAGWYSYSGTQLRATLGICQPFLPDARDGWALALDEVPTAPDQFLDRIARLGTVVGDMHCVLAADGEDPAFAPEEPTPETLGLLTATIEEQIDAVYAVLPDDEAVAGIVGRAEELREIARSLAPTALNGHLIRTHGDLHLGQVLWFDDDWFVTDFEGEPARSISDRRRKMIPLRDVAGMLRSFSYLVATLEGSGTPAPEWFEHEARTRFLAAYREAVQRTGLLPSAEGVQERLLDLFELEKVLYELRYELEHRPDWVGVPVAGIARFLDRIER